MTGQRQAAARARDPPRPGLRLQPRGALRVLPGLAEDLLHYLAARGGVLSKQRVEQVEGVVVIEGAGSPRSHPGTGPGFPVTSVVVPSGDPDIHGSQTAGPPASRVVPHQRHYDLSYQAQLVTVPANRPVARRPGCQPPP